MKLKPITAISVLSLMVASLYVSGCVTNTTNQTPNAATQHDAFLENFLTVHKNRSYSNSNLSMKVWELTWINSTSASSHVTAVEAANYTWSHDTTYMVFPTSQDATNYLNAMNKTEYSLASTDYPRNGTYIDATGHAPQIFKSYIYNEGNPYNISEFKRHEIAQVDNIVMVHTAKILYTA